MATRSKVFICYHPSTEAFVSELRYNLAVYEREIEGRLDVWDPSRIEPGARWREEIAAAIKQTRIAVLFVNAPFNASEFISLGQLPDLLKAAKNDGAKIIPVYAEPCVIPKEISRFRFLNPPRPGARVAANQIGRPRRQQLWVDLADAIAAELQRSPVDQLTMVASVDEQEERRAKEILADLERRHDLQFKLETWSRIDELERAAWQGRIGEASEIPGLLVFVGARGLGIWSDPDLRRALRSFNRSNRPLVFVLFAERPPDLEPPDFLAAQQVLDLGVADDREALAEKIAQRLQAPDYSERRKEPGVEVLEDAGPERAQGEIDAEIDEALDKIREELGRSKNLTLFVGAGVYPVGPNGSGNSGGGPDAESGGATGDRPGVGLHPLRLSAITHRLLDGLKLDYRELLPPVDVVGDYFDIGTQKEDELDQTLKSLCMEAAKGSGPTSTHVLIADAFRALIERQKRRDSVLVTRQPVNLIVTTNFDLMMERALLEAGVAFTRIVQHGTGDRIDVNEYREILRIGPHRVRIRTLGIPYELQRTEEDEEQKQTCVVDLRDVEDLYKAIKTLGIRRLEPVGGGEGVSDLQSFDLEGYTPPYLYKYHGSADIDGSCAVTTEQYFKFVRQVFTRGIISEKIKQVLSSGPILFFGYSMLDPDFRVTMHTLLRENPDPKHRYSIQSAPRDDSADHSERVEARFWEKVRKRAYADHSISILETSGEEFLEKLVAELDRRRRWK